MYRLYIRSAANSSSVLSLLNTTALAVARKKLLTTSELNRKLLILYQLETALSSHTLLYVYTCYYENQIEVALVKMN